jgi:hypothetical protein
MRLNYTLKLACQVQLHNDFDRQIDELRFVLLASPLANLSTPIPQFQLETPDLFHAHFFDHNSYSDVPPKAGDCNQRQNIGLNSDSGDWISPEMLNCKEMQI